MRSPAFLLFPTLMVILTMMNACASEPAAPPEAQAPSSPPIIIPQNGSIDVRSTPEGALIMLIEEDEEGAAISPPRPAGVTPVTLTDLGPGKYTIHIEKTGYRAFRQSVEVKPSETVQVHARLRR